MCAQAIQGVAGQDVNHVHGAVPAAHDRKPPCEEGMGRQTISGQEAAGLGKC